jgi:glutaryl-CoA transferase
VPRPLDGVRVLDLTRVLAGPFATMILGDLGAEIIKIEEPKFGDDMRVYHPLTDDGESVYFLAANRNKKSVAVDLMKAEGRELVRDLASTCDVMIENFRFGALDKYGLDYASIAAVNRDIIYCSISGFGRTSSMRERSGYDFVTQAESGLMSVTGDPAGEPMRVGVPISDFATAMWSSQAILAALLHHRNTGKGQFIDISLLDSVVSLLALTGTEVLFNGRRPQRVGNAHAAIVPYQAFPAKDGNFVLALANDRQYRTFCAAIGRPDLSSDPRFDQNARRVENRSELVAVLTAIFKDDTVDHWVDLLGGAGLPCGRIRHLEEALAAPEVIERDMVQEIENQFGHVVRVVGSPLHLSQSPICSPTIPPLLGEHTDDVLSRLLNLDQDSIDRLRRDGVVGPATKTAENSK